MAFIFDPEENEAPRREKERPSKRRKTARRAAIAGGDDEDEESSASSWFAPLLDGAESAACVKRRERLLDENWAKVDARIQVRCYGLGGCWMDLSERANVMRRIS